MLRWGLDWLIKVRTPWSFSVYLSHSQLNQAHPSDDTLIVQVGDSNVDNAYWGGDQSIPTPRKSFQINSSQ